MHQDGAADVPSLPRRNDISTGTQRGKRGSPRTSGDSAGWPIPEVPVRAPGIGTIAAQGNDSWQQ